MGKVVEYSEGSISEIGKLVSHRTIATEILARKRKAIESAYGIEWYYRLMSILAQHHGEYEEKPRTKDSLIVHFVDMLEANMTSLDQNFKSAQDGETVRFHGFYIS